jgi:hypothetical protein
MGFGRRPRCDVGAGRAAGACERGETAKNGGSKPWRRSAIETVAGRELATSKEGHQSLPPRRLPVVYFAAGHFCLLLAFLLLTLSPGAVAGFFYHPKMLAAVHLVTLGWITTSIVGATYIVCPLALRTPIKATALDGIACFLILSGISGVVSHMWWDEYTALLWSGLTTAIGFVLVAGKVGIALKRGKSPGIVRIGVACAWLNLLLAASLGTFLAYNKHQPVLKAAQLTAVFAHVHLAAVGFATLMVMSVGLRLIPMFLPAAPPQGIRAALPLLLVAGGPIVLAVSLLTGLPLAGPSVLAIVLGILLFFYALTWMIRHPRPAPPAIRRPDIGMVHAFLAFLCLLVSCGLGVVLVFSKEWHLRLIMVYGVLGLVGFLGQMVIGIGMRLFPLFAWIEAQARAGEEVPRRPLHGLASRTFEALTLAFWTAGVPLLAIGLGGDSAILTSLGGGSLFVAAAANSLNVARVIGIAFVRRAFEG